MNTAQAHRPEKIADPPNGHPGRAGYRLSAPLATAVAPAASVVAFA